MSKENVLKAITGLVASLQKSLHKVRQKTTQNTEDIDLLGDSVAELVDGQTALLTRIEELGKISVESNCQLSDKIEATRAQSFQRTEKLGAAVATVAEQLGPRAAEFFYPEGGLEKRHATLTTFVAGLSDDVVEEKKVNNDREVRQTLRDQNNVQALVNLKDSTQKAFDQVKTDVQNLIDSNSRLSTRLYKVEASYDDLVERAKAVIRQHVIPQPAPAPMPSDHVWVNKKLSGVYETCDDFETRVRKLEAIIKIYEDLRKAQLNLAEVNGAFLAGPAANDTPPSVWSKVGQGK